MSMDPTHHTRFSSGTLLKAALLCAFAATALVVYRKTSLGEHLSPETLGHLLDAMGLWAPFAFVGITGAGICLFVPASLFVLAAGIIFGTFKGFVYVFIGCVTGASGAFFIGRTLGRDFVSALMGDTLKKYDEAIRENGFETVFYIRLLNLPFTPMNFGLGLTDVRFRDYFLGTGLGVMTSVFIFTFFGGVLKEAWGSGDWGMLVSFKAGCAVALFLISLCVPLIIRRAKGKTWFGSAYRASQSSTPKNGDEQ